MLSIPLQGLHTGLAGLKVMYQSKGIQTRLIEGVFSKGGEIGPHTHPKGEDCAIVLSGQLGYWISNKEMLQIQPGEVVFGWRDVIHGYCNTQEELVHLLIFATPEKTGLEYPEDEDNRVIHLPLDERIIGKDNERVFTSEYSAFSFVTVSDGYRETNSTDALVVFVDDSQKLLYIFDREPVVLEGTGLSGKRLLRYEAKS
jgi:quercetin dioxygenase-like cupin family protein